MQFHLATKAPAGVRLIARVVNQNDTPDDLDAALVDGAKAAKWEIAAARGPSSVIAMLSRILAAT